MLIGKGRGSHVGRVGDDDVKSLIAPAEDFTEVHGPAKGRSLARVGLGSEDLSQLPFSFLESLERLFEVLWRLPLRASKGSSGLEGDVDGFVEGSELEGLGVPLSIFERLKEPFLHGVVAEGVANAQVVAEIRKGSGTRLADGQKQPKSEPGNLDGFSRDIDAVEALGDVVAGALGPGAASFAEVFADRLFEATLDGEKYLQACYEQ